MRSNFPAAQHNKMLKTENGIWLFISSKVDFFIVFERDSTLSYKKG